MCELAGPPRDRKKGDVIGSEVQRSKSSEVRDRVVEAYWFSYEPPSARQPHILKQSHPEKCPKLRHECNCDKWHREVVSWSVVRPPVIMVGKERERDVKKVKDQPGSYTVAPGIVQKWKDTIDEDEQYLTDSSGGFALK